MRHLLKIAALGGVAALASAAPASAYELGGHTWPGGRITYYNAAKAETPEVEAAVRAWNTSGARVRFIPASRRRAALVIAPLTGSAAGVLSGEGGEASLGHMPSGNRVWLRRLDVKHGWTASLVTLAATHELGHVLGLDHSSQCAVMDAVLESHCAVPHPWQYACGGLRPDDVRGAIARYGGRARRLAPVRYCDRTPVPGAPLRVTATYPAYPDEGSPGVSPGVRLSWTQPDAEIILGRDSVPGFTIFASPGTCSTDPVYKVYGEGDGASGTQVRAYRPSPGPGVWCFSVTAEDVWSRLGPAATVTVTIPADPPPAPDGS